MEWMLMPYRRYAEFSGRSRRTEYWMSARFMASVYAHGFGLMLAGGMLSSLEQDISGAGTASSPELGALFWIGAVALGLFVIASFVPSLAVIVRRLHDRDMSGWWYLGFIVMGVIPFVGWIASIALFVIMCLPGTPGLNRFGDDPKNPAGYDVFG